MHDAKAPFRLKTGNELQRLRNCVLTVAGAAIVVTCCYLWIDRPLAFWVHAHQNHFLPRDEFSSIADIPNPAVQASSILFLVLGFSQLMKRTFKYLERVALVCSTSVLIGETIKEVSKWVFGRPSPDLWINSNSSAIGSHEYQFHWFHGIAPFNSFPSGHMTATAAVIAILWVQYPRFRPLYAVCCLTVGAGLVAFNYHFLGDVIAGALLGTMVGLLLCYSLLRQNGADLD